MESSDLALSSSSSVEDVLNNDLILNHIMSKVKKGGRMARTLRLVHPQLNNLVLSWIPPRLAIRLPFRAPADLEDGEEGLLLFPYGTLKRMDPLLAQKVAFSEPAEDSPVAFSQLCTFCGQFKDSIRTLILRLRDQRTLQSTVFLLQTSCPNLESLVMKVAIEEWNFDLPELPEVEQPEMKPHLVFFKIIIEGQINKTSEDDESRELFLTLVQKVLDLATNLTRLVLEANLLPQLEELTKLKELTWKVTFSDMEHDHEDEFESHCDPTHLFRDFAEKLRSLSSLEELKLRFCGLDPRCNDCADVIQGKHIPPLLLSKLKKFVIVNPMVFMLDGGLGFKQFSQENLPLLETLEFRGCKAKFEDFQTRLTDFLNTPGNTVIPVVTLDLGFVTPDTCESLKLTPTVFPNLSCLKFAITDENLGQGEIDDGDDHNSLFKTTFRNCAGMGTLKQLKIGCFMKVAMRRLITALRNSDMFKSKALRKFSLDFGLDEGRGLLVDAGAPSAHDQLAIKLAESLRRTKHMDQVVFRNFMIPPTVLAPVLKTIDRLKLPVSFGNTQFADGALEHMSPEDEEEQ